jgi:hypothetical protein
MQDGEQRSKHDLGKVTQVDIEPGHEQQMRSCHFQFVQTMGSIFGFLPSLVDKVGRFKSVAVQGVLPAQG